MAVASRHLCRSLFQAGRLVPAKRKCSQPWRAAPSSTTPRCFSSCSSRRAQEDRPDAAASSSTKPRRQEKEAVSKAKSVATPAQQSNPGDNDHGFDLSKLTVEDMRTPSNPVTASQLDPDARAYYEALSKHDQERFLALENHGLAMIEAAAEDEQESRAASFISREISREFPMPSRTLARRDVGYWADEEDDEFGYTEDADDDFDESYITSVAESQLEVHREVREYMRIAAWDMPLLRKFSKPFEQPRLDQPLQFRYTTYMGESHPAASKVVVQFCTKDIKGLTEQQREKLIKLVGVRYNPDTDVVKMSCEKFEEAAQNKRYLGDLVGKLVTEAKDAKDSFADVPFDFRHHKPKRVPQYPEGWKLKPERVKELVEARQQTLALADGRPVVDGRRLVEEFVLVAPQGRPALKTA